MATDRAFRASCAVALGFLASLALWLRVTSPTFPAVNGDEAFYGVQAARLLEGRSVASHTVSGNLLNVLVIGPEVVLYALLGPSNLVIKLPAIGAGLLAVAGAWFCLRRTLDRPTAAIACGLMAVLPVAIIECRVGAEPAWNPLVGVLALGAAFRGHRLLTVLGFLLAYYVHPTYLFSAPVYALVLAVRIGQQAGWRRREMVPKLATAAVIGGAVLGGLAWLTSGRPVLSWLYETFDFGPMDWGRFAILYERLLMGFCECGPPESPPRFDRVFWGLVLAIGLPGAGFLAKQRRWECLALVVGLLISLAGLHTVTGPDILRPYFARYGLFLVAPSVAAMACLLRAWMPDGTDRASILGRRVQVVALIGLGFGLIHHTHASFFGHILPGTEGQERLATLRTETVDPKEWALRLIRDDRPEGADATVILAEDWWTYRPIEFLAGGDPSIRVGSLEFFDAATRERLIRRHLEAGGYVVGTDGAAVPRQVEALFPPDRRVERRVYSPPGACLVIQRLRRSGEPAADGPMAVLHPPGTRPPILTR